MSTIRNMIRVLVETSGEARDILVRGVLGVAQVSAILPVTGAAGTVVKITVADSLPASGATVGGVALTSFSILDAVTVQGTTGAHANGAVNVIVSNVAGASLPLVGGYLYVGGAAPTLTLVATSGGAVGDIDGGYTATLTGTNFTGATAVTFGGTAATAVVVVNSTTITCTVPAHATGLVSVVVTTPGGSNPANTAFRYFSLAELVISGYWRANYAGAPWVATATAGVSGTTGNLVVGIAPSTGTAQNGKTPALFVAASSQYLTNPTDATTLYTTGAGSILVLFKAVSAIAATGTIYQDPVFIRDSNSDLGMSFTTSGVGAYAYSSGYVSNTVACATGAYHLAMMRWDGVNFGLTIDSGAEQTIACGALTTMTGTVVVGQGYAPNPYLDANILELATAKYKVSNADYANAKAYINTRYNLTL